MVVGNPSHKFNIGVAVSPGLQLERGPEIGMVESCKREIEVLFPGQSGGPNLFDACRDDRPG